LGTIQGMTTITNFIDPSAAIGARSKVWHFACVMAHVQIGEDCSIGSRSEIGVATVIGDRSRVSSGVFLPANAKLGHDVFIGPNSTFTDDRYPRAGAAYNAQPPVIEDGASIGAGCVILPGVRIGAGAMVGAGSVVSKDVPPGAIVRGEAAVCTGHTP
jgi:UDP-2-acetamido-3-amino-2,3-dideoxy-glucuronate N-acetyltransferase